jgi:rhamnulokinase
MTTLAAVDLGAQSGRVAVGRFDGERLDVSEVHRFDNVPVQAGGTLHWDALGLFREVQDGLRAAVREAGPVQAVAVDSWAVDFGVIDAKGRLVQNPVHYRDPRRARAMDRVLADVPARELYERTGIQLIPINTIFELAAMAHDGDAALEPGNTLLLIPDLMHHWLCGSRTSELTNATTTQLFDARGGCWATDLAERLGIPPTLLPEVVPPGTPLAGVAEGSGLDGATVVAGGTHDTASAVAAIPFRRPDSVYISAGTWSLVGMELDEPLIDDATFDANLTNEGGVAGTYRLLRNVTGLWLLHECRRTWAAQGHERSFAELIALAEAAPALRSLIEPNDPAFADPGDMPARVRSFCARTGQSEPADHGAVVRCILESLALKHAQTVDVLARATSTTPAEIHVVGGGARNELLCRWTAEATGLPVLAGPEEATVLGNLLVQAIALGEIESIEDARRVVGASYGPTVYEPHAPAEWNEARHRFAELASLAVSA